jgi:hypothetical protein
MGPQLPSEWIAWTFAAAPFVIGAAILLVTYLMVRGQTNQTVPIGQTYACARCGRRGHREHMVPVAHEGAVLWYCAHCASLV